MMSKVMKLMITSRKAPGGLLITFCNYDYYQNQKNHDSTTDSTMDYTNGQPLVNQHSMGAVYKCPHCFYKVPQPSTTVYKKEYAGKIKPKTKSAKYYLNIRG